MMASGGGEKYDDELCPEHHHPHQMPSSSGSSSKRDIVTRMLSLDSSTASLDMRPYVLRSSSSGGQEQLMSPTSVTPVLDVHCTGSHIHSRHLPSDHFHDQHQHPLHQLLQQPSYSFPNPNPSTHSSLQPSVQQQPPSPPPPSSSVNRYDYTLKFLLVGDSDVGKEEILSGLNTDSSCPAEEEDPYGCLGVVTYKSTYILLDGKRIRLQVWDTSGGQGRFSTIIRSYSRGAQGILLVYDITNKWSFNGLNRWYKEVEQHAPGVPKILLGNRLHLAFKRQVSEHSAESYAHKHNMSFFEVSPLCNFNVKESFTELARIVLQRHGMESLWRNHTVLSLQELCCRAIVAQTTFYGIERLPLPSGLKSFLKSYSTHSNIADNSNTITIKPCFKIYSSTNHGNNSSSNSPSPFSSNSYKEHKDNTLRRKAKDLKALFVCDASSSSTVPSTSVTLGLQPRSRPVSRSSNPRNSDRVMASDQQQTTGQGSNGVAVTGASSSSPSNVMSRRRDRDRKSHHCIIS